jgi:LysM repeat protein
VRTRKRGIGKTAVILSFLFPAALLLTLAASHAAAQDVPTSTPDGEGFIRVTVQQDDSLWSIAARAGITIPDLLALNNLSEDVVLRPGDTLIVSKVTPPATPTSDIPTPTPQLPTATPTIVKPRRHL